MITCAPTCEPGCMRSGCPPIPCLPVPMLRPGGKARPRGGKDGYGGRAGGGTGHGNAESESWQITQKVRDDEQGQVHHCSYCTLPYKLNNYIWCKLGLSASSDGLERTESGGWPYDSILLDVNFKITRNLTVLLSVAVTFSKLSWPFHAS